STNRFKAANDKSAEATKAKKEAAGLCRHAGSGCPHDGTRLSVGGPGGQDAGMRSDLIRRRHVDLMRVAGMLCRPCRPAAACH
ncbi:hypothetical protein, partial [Streptomyces hydrogenans]